MGEGEQIGRSQGEARAGLEPSINGCALIALLDCGWLEMTFRRMVEEGSECWWILVDG
jgi:hypothetical protein